MQVLSFLLTLSTLAAGALSAGVVGKPVGFASGTTGGGNATPQTPNSPAQLKQWLEDDVTRVIVLDREFSFKGSEGTCTNCAGCQPSSYTCGAKGQLAIALPGQTWCDGQKPATVTYDKAPLVPIQVKSNKSIVGVGAKGVIRGKGLRMANGVRNVIIQNIHITDLNPQYIWGGDALVLVNTDQIWIDHCKVSLIGRQMFVTGFETAGRVTVSNTEFDGQTSWSASCDGRHYWSILGLGKNDLITFTNNYVHHTSGRSPKLENANVWHAVNNYWFSNTGHAFDVGTGSQALIEGNVFEDVARTVNGNTGQIFAPVSSTATQCQASLSRSCQPNSYANSPAITSNGNGFLSTFKNHQVAPAMAASNVKASVLKNAGVGKI